MTILGVFAHPDDETFGPGGTFALLAAAGHAVHLWCATRGEAGTIGRSLELGRERLAAVREAELKEAARVLGMFPPMIQDYPDSGLGSASNEAMVSGLVQVIRDLRPDVVITFHPNGLSGHPDHRAVTQYLLQAVFLAGKDDQPALGSPHRVRRVLGYCFLESRVRQITWREIHGVPDDAADLIVDTRSYIPTKLAAVDAHVTQKPFIENLESRLGGLDDYWAMEAFQVLWGEPYPDHPRPATNVLAGLD